MEYNLGQQITRIGRSLGNDIVLAGDSKVSRDHAEIRHEGGALVIHDLNSRNGTWVNGARVTKQRLKDGDQIQIGNTRITFINGALLVPDYALGVGREQRPVAHVPQSRSTTTPIAAVIGIVLIGALALAVILGRSGSTHDRVEDAARQWVTRNTDGIATVIVDDPAVWLQIPLEHEPLLTMVRERVAKMENWGFTTPEKEAEGVYRLRATATLSLPLTQREFTIVARYLLTVNMNTSVVTAEEEEVQVK